MLSYSKRDAARDRGPVKGRSGKKKQKKVEASIEDQRVADEQGFAALKAHAASAMQKVQKKAMMG